MFGKVFDLVFGNVSIVKYALELADQNIPFRFRQIVATLIKLTVAWKISFNHQRREP